MAQRYDLLVAREDEKDKSKSWWTKIGVAFENRSGDGYQLLFDALPIGGKDGQAKVIMKQPSEKDERRG